MAIILSLETSTTVCSAALHDNENLIALAEIHREQSHAAKLAVLVQDVVRLADIEMSAIAAVAISSGPGSYTGLRIGTSTAKGLCYALSIPLVAVGTLELLAAQVNRENHRRAWLCPMIDARRMEVYCLLADADRNLVQGVAAKIIDEHSFADELEQNRILFFGNGSGKCRVVINHPQATFIAGVTPSAAGMGPLAWEKFRQGKLEDVTYFEPFYLKEFRIKKPAQI
jgi:tRNA threonylcarbamoyladenosine biosynthesis protein TsaB